MKRTGGIIATILTSIFLGIPGLVLGFMGMIAVFVPSTQSRADQQIGSLVLLVGGLILVLIPIIVGTTTMRKKKTSESASPISTTLSPTTAQVPTPTSVETPTITTPVAPPLPSEPVINMPTATVQTPIISATTTDLAAEIRTRLLVLNRPTAPWQIVDGKSEGVDLIAEWKIVDATWKEIFSKAKLSKTYRIYMKFDPTKKEVRTMDKETTVQWQAGFPTFHAEASTFKGQQTSISFGTGYAFTETLASGQVYKYRFNSNEMKKPIQDAIKEAGWNYKGVAFGKL